MKSLLLTLSLLVLTGCATVTTPVKHEFPEPSKVLTERCPQLKQLAEGEERLSELTKTVAENYTLYHECSTKQELLVKWYTEQKHLYDAIFNKR
jgi:hypothetical protein